MVSTLPSKAGGEGSVRGWRGDIPHAWLSKTQTITQKQYCHKFSKDLKWCTLKKKFGFRLLSTMCGWFSLIYLSVQTTRASLVAKLVEHQPQCRRPGFDPWVGKIPWRRDRLPTPVFWPGESHGLCSPWGRKESDTTDNKGEMSCPLS